MRPSSSANLLPSRFAPPALSDSSTSKAAQPTAGATEEQEILKEDVALLKADIERFKAIEKEARTPGNENNAEVWLKYDRGLASAEASASGVDSGVALHRNAVDVVTDLAGQIVGAVVIAAAAVAGAR